MVAYSLSFSALIYSGGLADGMGFGMSAAMIGAGIGCVIIPRLGSIPLSIAGPDTPTVAVLAALAFGISATMPADMTPSGVIGAVVLALALTTVLAGAALCLIGFLRLGVWMRFVPYPVIAGFLAASGWFLATGAYRVMTGMQLDPANPAEILSERNMPLWGTGLAVFALLVLVRRVAASPLAIPLTLSATIMVAAATVILGEVPIEAAQDAGWLFKVPVLAPGATPWSAVSPSAWELTFLIPHIPEMIAVAGVTSMAILLNVTGYEVAKSENADLDTEMRASGIANLLSAAAGGLVTNVSFTRTLLNISIGATGRRSALICGLLCLGFAFGGQQVITYVSAPVIGGLLLYLGSVVMWPWVVESVRRIALAEYLLILAILVLIVQFGYLAGAVLGIVASCLFFAFNYSRIPFIRQDLSRRTCTSTVERSREHRQVLEAEGDRIRLLKLQGYIFFGTANRLVDYVRQAIADNAPSQAGWLVVDFTEVKGIDSSARFSFVRLTQITAKNGYRLVLSSLPSELEAVFLREGLIGDGPSQVPVFANPDGALEWAEEALLAHLGAAEDPIEQLTTWLATEFDDAAAAETLSNAMQRRDCAAGTLLCRQGEPSDSFYFVVSGRVSILLERHGADPIRLRSMLGRTVIGEMGFYRRANRTAGVRVDEAGIVYELDRAAFDRLAAEQPQVANSLNIFIVRTLADRLAFANGEIAALQQ